MSRQRPLRGACSCGRNHYSIIVPVESVERALVYFDDSSESRRSQASPLTAWLRVPLDWVSSTTFAQFPDETHSTIRRTFTPLHAPHCKRVFCGYCGTHLSYWSEQPPEEAEFLNVTLGSLLGEDIRALQDLDLLPDDVGPEDLGATSTENGTQEAVAPANTKQKSAQPRITREGRSGDLDWFEEMIDGSKLGRTQRTRKGMGASADGSITVQWEVSEWTEGDSEPPTPSAKRKLGDLSGDDVNMRD